MPAELHSQRVPTIGNHKFFIDTYDTKAWNRLIPLGIMIPGSIDSITQLYIVTIPSLHNTAIK